MRFAFKEALKNRFEAIGYALEGLVATYKTEPAFRYEIWLLVPVVFLSLFLPFSWAFRALLLASWVWVLLVELLNTAIESVCNEVNQEKRAFLKKSKDAAAAAVFLSISFSVFLWVVAFFYFFWVN